MSNMKEILQQLSTPLPDEYVKTKPAFKDREGNLQEVSYIEWFTAADLLDEISPSWQLEIVEVGSIEGRIFIRTAIAINGVRRENIGFENSTTDSYGDPFSNAFAMAFKRTAAMFGLGRYLYHGGHRQKTDVQSQTNSAQFNRPASDRQKAAVMNLLHDTRLTDKEKRRIELVIANGLTQTKASEILDFFYGKKIKQNGQWIKVSPGVLDEREQSFAA